MLKRMISPHEVDYRREKPSPAPFHREEAPGLVDRDRIAQRAYERFQQRGGSHGGDQDDWLEAERELKSLK